jgi:spore maturation protein CgeB
MLIREPVRERLKTWKKAVAHQSIRCRVEAVGMNVLLLGKIGSIIHWTEDVASDLRIAGHAVTVVPTRDPRLSKSIERALLSPAIGAPLAARIVRKMRHAAPDLILAIGCLDELPLTIFQRLADAPGRPPMVAWIGDTFTEQMAGIAGLFDLIAYTDTGMLGLHQTLGFRSDAAFVPLGATRAVQITNRPGARIASLAFPAAPTPNRRTLLAEITEPVAIFGPGWGEAAELAHHRRDARRIDARELAEIYANHIGVLNIRHAVYVINGLNHRHFAPYMQGTPVVTDAQPDIPHCFEVETEMLTYQNARHLDEVCAELRRDPSRAAAIGMAGRRRVLACHTYAHRLDTIAALLGDKTWRMNG